MEKDNDWITQKIPHNSALSSRIDPQTNLTSITQQLLWYLFMEKSMLKCPVYPIIRL